MEDIENRLSTNIVGPDDPDENPNLTEEGNTATQMDPEEAETNEDPYYEDKVLND